MPKLTNTKDGTKHETDDAYLSSDMTPLQHRDSEQWPGWGANNCRGSTEFYKALINGSHPQLYPPPLTHKQHPCPSNTRCWFPQFLVIYRCLDKGQGRVPSLDPLSAPTPVRSTVDLV